MSPTRRRRYLSFQRLLPACAPFFDYLVERPLTQIAIVSTPVRLPTGPGRFEERAGLARAANDTRSGAFRFATLVHDFPSETVPEGWRIA